MAAVEDTFALSRRAAHNIEHNEHWRSLSKTLGPPYNRETNPEGLYVFRVFHLSLHYWNDEQTVLETGKAYLAYSLRVEQDQSRYRRKRPDARGADRARNE